MKAVMAARAFRRLLAGAVVLYLAAGASIAAELLTGVAAQTNSTPSAVRTVTVAGDWLASCQTDAEATSCRMSTLGRGVTAQGSAVTIQLASDASKVGGRLFVFLTPLDLLLARGVEMRIDGGAAQKLAFRSCHVQGCVIPFRLTRNLENRFRRGSKLVLRLFEIDGKPIDIEMSLIGFIAATRAVEGG